MNKFKEIPASKTSLSGRKLILGVATNDSSYMVSVKIDGKWVSCKFYSTWMNMLRRCYCKKHQSRFPTYKGCTVSKEWLLFSAFKSWMEKQEWEGNQLDKDLLVHNNKVYSENTCMFVSPEINSMLVDSASSRGDYPQGVCFMQGKYQAYCNSNGAKINLGTYNSPEEASHVYRTYKYNLIVDIANKQIDSKLRNALLNQAEIFRCGL